MNFIETNGALQIIIAANRTRAIAAGIDPNEYQAVCESLTIASDWPKTFIRTGQQHYDQADEHKTNGELVSASEEYLMASLWFHFATCIPNPNSAEHKAASVATAKTYRHALDIIDPKAQWIDKGDSDQPFAGVLRHPDDQPSRGIVLIIPGLDSGKEEFHVHNEALLRRGLSTFAFNGPAQVELSVDNPISFNYEQIVSHVIDTLTEQYHVEAHSIRVMALSLGGYYAMRSAATDTRIERLLTVSGVCELDWRSLPQLITDTLTQRAGSSEIAQAFAKEVHGAQWAKKIMQPWLSVSGTEDIVPTPAQAQAAIGDAVNGSALFVEGGDHLVSNARWKWAAKAYDWLAAS
jgi:hypothetical protein